MHIFRISFYDEEGTCLGGGGGDTLPSLSLTPLPPPPSPPPPYVMSRRSSTCLRILSVSILSYLTQDVNILRTIVDKILKIQESVKVVVMSKNTLVWSLYLILSSRPRSNLRSPMCPSRLPCLHGGGALAVIINSNNYNYIAHKRMREKLHQKVCTIGWEEAPEHFFRRTAITSPDCQEFMV